MTKTKLTIDWNSAPEGYPIWIHHHNAALGTVGLGGWYREEGDRYYNQDGCFWGKHCEGDYITVFRAPVKAWHETGDLPPVGERVLMVGIQEPTMLYISDHDRWKNHVGMEVTIVGHGWTDGEGSTPIAIYEVDCETSFQYHAMVAKCFKPAPTEEEKAAAAKEAFVREAHAICLAGGSWGLENMLQRLYDAGYRRE